MIEEYRLKTRRRKISRKSLWFVLAGFLIIFFDIAIINWTLTLPQGLGGPIWTGIFTLGVVLIVYSSSLTRVAPPALSKVHSDHVEKWEKSGDLVTKVNNLTQDETLTLLAFTSKRFGKYVLKSGTRPNGKTWALKESRVGSKILAVRGYEVRAAFDVILYRRDLASQQGIRRPWRKISTRNDNLQTIKLVNLIELPKWVMS